MRGQTNASNIGGTVGDDAHPIKEINAGKKFKMIVQASALLDADESLNISEQVLAKVNELYKAEKAKK